MNDLGIPGEVSGDSVVGVFEAGSIGLVFVHNAIRRRSGGMDETNFLLFSDHEESHVLVEPDDSDAGASLDDLGEKTLVVEPSPDVHLFLRDKGADDALRGLPGQTKSFYLEAGIAKDGGNEIATGNLSGSGSLAGSVKAPRRSQPAAHHFGKNFFEKPLRFVDYIGDFLSGAGAGIALCEGFPFTL